jgi:hypothetical protein
MRVNRHHVNNGDDVTFHGQLKGRRLPVGGKLVELQIYSGRLWRTLGTARANATTGLWRRFCPGTALGGRRSRPAQAARRS